jgi:hypothetical protein
MQCQNNAGFAKDGSEVGEVCLYRAVGNTHTDWIPVDRDGRRREQHYTEEQSITNIGTSGPDATRMLALGSGWFDLQPLPAPAGDTCMQNLSVFKEPVEFSKCSNTKDKDVPEDRLKTIVGTLSFFEVPSMMGL